MSGLKNDTKIRQASTSDWTKRSLLSFGGNLAVTNVVRQGIDRLFKNSDDFWQYFGNSID